MLNLGEREEGCFWGGPLGISLPSRLFVLFAFGVLD